MSCARRFAPPNAHGRPAARARPTVRTAWLRTPAVLPNRLSGSAYQSGKMRKRAIVGAFSIRRKKAPRQLAGPQMITDALATESLPRASVIAARTLLEVLGLSTFHRAPVDREVRSARPRPQYIRRVRGTHQAPQVVVRFTHPTRTAPRSLKLGNPERDVPVFAHGVWGLRCAGRHLPRPGCDVLCTGAECLVAKRTSSPPRASQREGQHGLGV